MEQQKPRNKAVKKGAPAPGSVVQNQTQAVNQKGYKSSLDVLRSSSKYLENFNPENSRREKNKRRQFSTQKSTTKKGYMSIYDDKGRIRETGEDICDCFEHNCDGCFFPCFSCASLKCAIRCRVNRRFIYEKIEFDGKETQKLNPFFLKYQ